MKKDIQTDKQSRLINVLREGVTIVQMVLFKEVRAALIRKHPDRENTYISILAGTITNELFDTVNPDEKFLRFRNENKGLIEQELLKLAEEIPQLLDILSDALRVQSLCNYQEGTDSPNLLKKAKELGILVTERDIPLPSTFMTEVRELGSNHNLIVPPIPISPEEDKLVQ